MPPSPPRRLIVSVHVPKTAGTSFIRVLESCFGDRLLRDYDDQVMGHGPLSRVLRSLYRYRLQSPRLARYDCVHGHFQPLKYRYHPGRSLAIWLRDPVERVVSRYHHYRRHADPADPQFRRYLKRTDLSLTEFARVRHFQNLYAHYLVGVRLRDFDFIGITERYAEGLALFGRVYGLDCVAAQEVPTENLNPEKQGARYVIDDATRDLIERTNRRDMALYREALALNAALVERHLRP